MKRSPLKRKPRASVTDHEAAHTWWRAVVRGKRCVACGSRHHLEGHHIIAQQAIKREFPHGAIWRYPRLASSPRPGSERWERAYAHDIQEYVGGPFRTLQELLWDPRNGIALCRDCHGRHTNAAGRVRAIDLPAAAVAFATELHLEHRLSERYYG